MKVTGEAALQAPPDRAQAALRDPAALARAIPGCQDLAVTGPGACRLTITAAVASTAGTYTGEAKLVSHGPDSLTVMAGLAGARGTITATVHAKLTETADGATRISYDADAELAGLIGSVGQRLLAGTADRLATQFFAALDAGLAQPVPGRSPAGAASEPVPGRSPAGAAGVASPTDPSTRGASGRTTQPRTVPCQPAGRLGAAPPAGRLGAAPAAPRSFAAGVLTGAALTLAAVILARRRTRP